MVSAEFLSGGGGGGGHHGGGGHGHGGYNRRGGGYGPYWYPYDVNPTIVVPVSSCQYAIILPDGSQHVIIGACPANFISPLHGTVFITPA